MITQQNVLKLTVENIMTFTNGFSEISSISFKVIFSILVENDPLIFTPATSTFSRLLCTFDTFSIGVPHLHIGHIISRGALERLHIVDKH